jgi:hypothetical protein
MLRTRERMGRHEIHALGNVRRHRVDDGLLDRTHVGDDAAGLQVLCDGFSDGAVGADGRGDDHEISAGDRARVVVGHLVANLESERRIQGFLAPRAGDDGVHHPVAAHRERHGRPDQPDADEGNAVEQHRLGRFLFRFRRGLGTHDPSCAKAARASRTAAVSSSLPMVMRK